MKLTADVTIKAISPPDETIRLPDASKSPQAAKITIRALLIKCIITDGNIEPERIATNAKTQPARNW